jgi:radical SAM protein with 4Fe4S-binding SPASM domain
VQAILIPVAAPEYWAYALQRRGLHNKRLLQFLGNFVGGCLADKGMVYIKPNGDVWACPFLPVPVGNVRKEKVDGIWNALQTFRFEHNENACDRCEYARVCGGCKSRMMLDSNYECAVNKAV